MNKENLDSIFKEISKKITPIINEVLVSDTEKRTHELVKYQIAVGGKRIRPVIATIACRMMGGKDEDVIYPAAGLEVLHNYTLIVDDIIDHGIVRRGKPTTWKMFGSSIAECMGINYAASIFQLANKSKYPVKISELFSRVMKNLVEGEISDILFEQSGRDNEIFVVKNRYTHVSESNYLKMITQKTGLLFKIPCEVGGICAEAKEKDIELLKEFGLNTGILFQITDDILDIFGDKEKFGKKIGKDIQEKKLGNIVILFALKELEKKDKKNFHEIISKNRVTNNDIKEAMKLINKTKSREKSLKLAEKYAKKAMENLKLLPQNEWNEKLNLIINFILHRES